MECPTCGAGSFTEAGVRQHHTKVHDEPLPYRTRSDCGTRFYDPKARLEYCGDCNPNAGSNNGNWSDATETTKCRECGDKFEFYPSEKDGIYCSSCVDAADGLLPDNPMEPIERVETSCLACGKQIRVLQSRLDRRKRGVFCDLQCYGDWLSENIVGPDHHQWTGSSPEYGQGWYAIRRAARLRDEYECQICGTSKDEMGCNPDVHHITPLREFDDPREAHRLDNVISLCRSCHRKAKAGAIEVPEIREE
jgi:5-methylcytosine-specific restriction endonuclease McrA